MSTWSSSGSRPEGVQAITQSALELIGPHGRRPAEFPAMGARLIRDQRRRPSWPRGFRDPGGTGTCMSRGTPCHSR